MKVIVINWSYPKNVSRAQQTHNKCTFLFIKYRPHHLNKSKLIMFRYITAITQSLANPTLYSSNANKPISIDNVDVLKTTNPHSYDLYVEFICTYLSPLSQQIIKHEMESFGVKKHRLFIRFFLVSDFSIVSQEEQPLQRNAR